MDEKEALLSKTLWCIEDIKAYCECGTTKASNIMKEAKKISVKKKSVNVRKKKRLKKRQKRLPKKKLRNKAHLNN